MDADQTRATPQHAAELLGISVEAVRQRIRRGTLRSDKDKDGSVWVYLDESVRDTDSVQTTDQTLYTTHLENEISYLRQQLEQANERDREQRRIIAALTQRIPELEAPSEPRESPETATVATEEANPRPERVEEHVPWWRRWFG
jgi:seryl-tRNA synthetase